MIRLGVHLGRGSCIISTSKRVWSVSFVSYDWKRTSLKEDTISMLRILVPLTVSGGAGHYRILNDTKI